MFSYHVLETAQSDENQGEEVRERKGSKYTKSVVLSLIQRSLGRKLYFRESSLSGGLLVDFGVSVQAEPTAIWILSPCKLGQVSMLLILTLENRISGRRA